MKPTRSASKTSRPTHKQRPSEAKQQKSQTPSESSIVTRRAGGRTKTAGEVFRTCPECGSPNLIRLEDEVICEFCGWDSVALSVAVHQYDELESGDEIGSREDAAAATAKALIAGSAFIND